VLSRAQSMDFCPAKSKTLFSPQQKSTDFCPRRPQTADYRPASLLFTWHRNWRWLATRAKCFMVLLGSPADGGQMFFVRGQLSKILNMFDRPKHCFRTKVFVFLPADYGFLSKNKCFQTKIHHLCPALVWSSAKNELGVMIKSTIGYR
jgi:hypothetical protein